MIWRDMPQGLNGNWLLHHSFLSSFFLFLQPSQSLTPNNSNSAFDILFFSFHLIVLSSFIHSFIHSQTQQ
ncbi:MAG: hypothetical protein J3R72DRAFT_460881, partial [Linnemannia gamsii]